MKRRDSKKETASPPQRKQQPKTTVARESTAEEDAFEARRSTRVSSSKYSHDGDTWQETLAVCEIPAKDGNSAKMIVRSYYVNLRTSERIWDEPPSGASHILPATDEMRKMADVQLDEMQISFGGVAEEKKKGGFFTRKKDAQPTTGRGKIQYKPGSFLSRVKKQSSSSTKKVKNDQTLDPDVQRAIALSMAETSAQSSTDGEERRTTSKQAFQDDEEALAMVLALSASEANTEYVPMSEEEMFQRALEESKRASKSTSEVARAPSPEDEFLAEVDLMALNLSSSPDDKKADTCLDQKMPAKSSLGKASADSDLDQKMPAKERKPTTFRDDTRKEPVTVKERAERKASSRSSNGAVAKPRNGASKMPTSKDITAKAALRSTEKGKTLRA